MEKRREIKTQHILFNAKVVHSRLGEMLANGQCAVEVGAARATR